LTLEELAKRLPESNITLENIEATGGLSNEAVKYRLKMFGQNKLKPPKKV